MRGGTRRSIRKRTRQRLNGLSRDLRKKAGDSIKRKKLPRTARTAPLRPRSFGNGLSSNRRMSEFPRSLISGNAETRKRSFRSTFHYRYAYTCAEFAINNGSVVKSPGDQLIFDANIDSALCSERSRRCCDLQLSVVTWPGS